MGTTAYLKAIMKVYVKQLKSGSCIIRVDKIYHECEDGIEKSVPRITDWHHLACCVMTIGDSKGRILLSHPHE